MDNVYYTINKYININFKIIPQLNYINCYYNNCNTVRITDGKPILGQCVKAAE